MFLWSHIASCRNFIDLVKKLGSIKKKKPDRVHTDFIQGFKTKPDTKKHVVPNTVEKVELCIIF